MAAVLENENCNACGADVRPQALFCYNCGGAVAAENDEAISTVNVDSKESLTESNNQKAAENLLAAERKAEVKEIDEDKKTNIQPPSKLKSAAAPRRKSRSFQPKKIEVVWEEHENAPNVWFLAVAVFLTAVAAVILFLAIYLK